jgi:crossover junction endodeoxyribonuclease RuvC
VIVLGVDPGTAVTGYGVVELREPGPHRLIECGVVRAPAREPLEHRLVAIFDAITDLIARHRPDAVALETIFVARNARSAILLGQARGVILLAVAQANMPLAEYAPAQIKKSVVGTGAATKAQVQRMSAQLLRLRTPPAPADAADGVAVALTHCMRAGRRFRRAVVG